MNVKEFIEILKLWSGLLSGIAYLMRRKKQIDLNIQ